MILSPAGEIAVNELEKTPDIRSNVLLDTWIVMPNHIHAIIILEETPIAIVETPRRGVS
jgi:putative transposase